MLDEIPGALRCDTFARDPSENPPEPPFVKGGAGGIWVKEPELVQADVGACAFGVAVHVPTWSRKTCL